MIINGLGSTKDNTYYSTSTSKSEGQADFDSTLEAATIIYAKPDTSATAYNNSSGNSITSPTDMDSIFKEASNTYGVSENLLKAVAKAESDFNPNSSDSISMCVGNLFLLTCEVIAAAMTVGLYLFPISFCIISTGRIPPCSEPTTGLKSA